MDSASYGITTSMGEIDFDEAVGRVTEALKQEGFGIITEIDVKKTLKTKLDIDYKKYTILGACNPKLAHQAIQTEPLIGLLLPCNVVVYENEDAGITVSAVNPSEIFKAVDNPDLQSIAGQVQDKLNRVIQSVG